MNTSTIEKRTRVVANTVKDEYDLLNRLFSIYPTGIVSVVSDTLDFWHVLTNILPSLKDKIMSRDGKLVIRPDSGDPADIICGTYGPKELEQRSSTEGINSNPNELGAIQILWEVFGGTVNDKGFKELDPHIGLIYGDSITYERAQDICDRLEAKGFASTNVVFGMGSFSFQYNTRDVFGSAVKATWVETDGVGHNIKKDPVTDDGLKKSATGRLAVLSRYDGSLYLVEKATPQQEAQSLLRTVWENGKFVRKQSFADVRSTLKRSTEILERAGKI